MTNHASSPKCVPSSALLPPPSSTQSKPSSSCHISTSGENILDPSKTWIFMVGINDQWENDRNEIGDVALYQAFVNFYAEYNQNTINEYYKDDVEHECFGHDEKILFIKDGNATTTHVRNSFLQMLQKTKEGDSMVLYLGGHGRRTCFCTHDDRNSNRRNGRSTIEDGGGWMYTEIVGMIETYFGGDFALILLDCCFAGNFSSALRDRQLYRHQSNGNNCNSDDQIVTNISYGCIMVTSPNESAQVHWTLTECLIRALNCNRIGCSHDDDMEEIDTRKDGVITLDEVVSYVSDHITKEKRDLATAYFVGNYYPEATPFLRMRPLTPSFHSMRPLSPRLPTYIQSFVSAFPPTLSSFKAPDILPESKFTKIENHISSENNKRTKRKRPSQPPSTWDVWLNNHLSASSSSSPKTPPLCVGSKVFTKVNKVRRLEGSKIFNGVDLHIMPMWFGGTVLSINSVKNKQITATKEHGITKDTNGCSNDHDDKLVTIELIDYATCSTWQTAVWKSSIISNHHFCHHVVHARGSCVMIHCHMAMADDIMSDFDVRKNDINSVTHKEQIIQCTNEQQQQQQQQRKKLRGCRRYLSFELKAGTEVRVLWKDLRFHRATVAFLDDVSWDDMILSSVPPSSSKTRNNNRIPSNNNSKKSGIIFPERRNNYGCFGNIDMEGGAHIPVIWKEQKTHSLVPLSRCIVCSDLEEDFPSNGRSECDDDDEEEVVARVQMIARSAASEARKNIRCPREALMRSMKSAGKFLRSVCNHNSNHSNEMKLTCFWPERGMWYDARAVDIRCCDNSDDYNVDNIPLEALAGHLCYEERGIYHAVKWDVDGIISLLPKAFVRRKERTIEL